MGAGLDRVTCKPLSLVPTEEGATRGGQTLGSVFGSAKRCRVCGDELDCHDYGGGSVWSCTTHGVRDWDFGSDAHWSRGAAPSAAKIGAPKVSLAPGAAAPRPAPARPSPARAAPAALRENPGAHEA